MFNKFRCKFFATFTAICAMHGAAAAAESAWVDAGRAKVRLVAAGSAADDPSVLRAGVEISLAPGWHTYWRYPGDAGVPPRFDWSGSENVAAIDVRWPAPQTIVEEGGARIIGYKRAVTFPLRVRTAEPNRRVKLRLHFQFATCEKLCIPAEARLALETSVGKPASHTAIDAAEARVPKRVALAAPGKVTIHSVSVERSPPRLVVEAAVPSATSPELFVEGPDESWAFPVPEPAATAAGRARFVVPAEPVDGRPFPPRVRLTLVAGEHAIEVDAPLD